MSVRAGHRPRAPQRLSGVAAGLLVERARRLADLAAEGGQPERGEELQFRIELRDLSPESFPPPSDVARFVAAAWIAAARAFTAPGAAPETRAECAPLLAEATRLLDRHLNLHRTDLAQPWKRHTGDFD